MCRKEASIPADDITISLELPGFTVTRQTREPDRYVIWVESTAYGAVCPRCGRASTDYHDGYERTVRDFPILGRPVYLRVWQRGRPAVINNISSSRVAVGRSRRSAVSIRLTIALSSGCTIGKFVTSVVKGKGDCPNA